MNRKKSLLLAVIGVLAISLAIVFGPFFSIPEYSWVRHSTSELAGQNMPGAWIMRTGFVVFGACTAMASLLGFSERRGPRAALLIFGLGMIATAVWSNVPIDTALPADLSEDRLHSLASAVVGTSFAVACALSLFGPAGKIRDWLSWIGLIVSVVVPLAMNELPEVRGLLQKAMFFISFVYIVREFSINFSISNRNDRARVDASRPNDSETH